MKSLVLDVFGTISNQTIHELYGLFTINLSFIDMHNWLLLLGFSCQVSKNWWVFALIVLVFTLVF